MSGRVSSGFRFLENFHLTFSPSFYPPLLSIRVIDFANSCIKSSLDEGIEIEELSMF